MGIFVMQKITHMEKRESNTTISMDLETTTATNLQVAGGMVITVVKITIGGGSIVKWRN